MENQKAQIAILLATYNGEKYLDEQMCSIFSQTYDDFFVIARDDGSSDSTPAILARWAAKHPGRIIVVSDNRGNLRFRANFSLLMELCDASYFACCDQDDIWLPDKLQLSMDEIQRLEIQYGESVPILVHSDLRVVDENLHVLCPSYFTQKRADLTTDTKLPTTLFKNIVAGCTAIGNRALLELARPIPEEFVFHDWWLGLIAASCGILSTITVPTVLYRQHGKNANGAGSAAGWSALWDGRHVLQQPALFSARARKTLGNIQSQALLLLCLFGERMSKRNRELLQAVCLPLLREETVYLSRARRIWLLARFFAIHIRLFPLTLRLCS